MGSDPAVLGDQVVQPSVSFVTGDLCTLTRARDHDGSSIKALIRISILYTNPMNII